MKYLVLVFAAVLFFACSEEKKENENSDVAKLQKENEELKKQAEERDQVINEFLTSFDDIQANLNMIKEKENIITLQTKGDVELEQDAKDQINEDVQLIYELMIENKKKINNLQYQLKNSNLNIGKLEKMVADLSAAIEAKDTEINNLQDELAHMDIVVEKLSSEIEELVTETETQTETINSQTEELNTAFYAYGTEKELKTQQILTKEGGFIGLGKIEKLREDFNKGYFTKIDITKVKEIKLNAKKARLVTTHPAGSYKFCCDKTFDSIIILNAKEFWSASKYLVIVVD
ncbi:MAG: hypothetical protein A2W91_12155 [Bacteroidetes bacterium GWF2_38_335]|nr:MAG: hypothetical protein A2W91_12155 [Bacteroidetes bacterium GWF2_38_335]OFY76925.1 MAG: hypothetical protein A2281_00270 [Bacteroidetes bacterium RIFOXYA12_FULL_38_20]HBS86775.1 hypothetical protein [Bacteroidales bacterium]